MKRQVTEWEKTFAMCVSDKDLYQPELKKKTTNSYHSIRQSNFLKINRQKI